MKNQDPNKKTEVQPDPQVPIAQERPSQVEAPEVKAVETVATELPYRILAVDDSSMQRKIMQKIFAADMYDLSVAEGGEDAIKLLSEKNFDVLLLDIEMEGMNGFEVCRYIRDEMTQVILPIIFVSSHVGKDIIQQALSVGGDEFVIKPLDKASVLNRVNAAAIENRLLERLDNTELVLFSVAHMAEAFDESSGDHCDRLFHMCNVFADKLGLSEEDRITLGYASVLHDIGKIAVPNHILAKQTHLNEEEWRMMKRHTVIGAEFAKSIKNCGSVVDIIRYHHEKFDGTGYPDGLKGYAIPYLARVFQIVDIYDSMSNNRIYNDAFPRDRVITVMAKEAQNGLRDSQLMHSFLEIACKNPDLLVRKTMAPEPMSNYKLKAIIDSTMKAGNKELMKS